MLKLHEMDGMHNAIFCDPHFVDKFLTVDSTRLQTVLDACRDDLDAFRFPEDITRERQLYTPIRKVLNIIKHAVDCTGDLGELPAFVDVASEPIPSHRRNMTAIKPDLALFDGPIRHWETMRMPVEVKKQATYLKTGMKQLARYAHGVFGQQLHRRHLYGLVICKWDATFVRFDRSGILYSKPIDMGSEKFRKAFAGLMMLSEMAFGYDTAFTTCIREDGRLQYYVDLPAEAFSAERDSSVSEAASTTADESSNPPTVRLKVVERLCHREEIRGRATAVVRLRKVIRPGYWEEPEEPRRPVKKCSRIGGEQHLTGEVLGTRDYVLKMMWRDPSQKVEGEALERFVGIYGVGQYMWHRDVSTPCSPPICVAVDMTPSRDLVLVAKNLTDLNIEIPEEEEGEGETQYTEVQTDEYLESYAHRMPRVYCRLLTSTVGSPLRSAESPRQLLQAVLDAILGYWRLVNMGVLHRDISDGNVLMLRKGQGYNKRDWKVPCVPTNELDPELVESERLLGEVLDGLGRDPTGMVNDFDLFTTYGEADAPFFDASPKDNVCEVKEPELKRRKLNPETVAPPIPSSSSTEDEDAPEEPHSGPPFDFPVGTPAFMCARVLKVKPGCRFEHHFMDDLESFFWVILVCVLEHVDTPGGRLTQDALDLLRTFNQHDRSHIADSKLDLLGACAGKGKLMLRALASCENSWASDPAIISVVLQLGRYFYDNYDGPYFLCPPTMGFPSIVKPIMDALDL